METHNAPIPTVANATSLGQTWLLMSKRFYITTAIDYVNGEPHLGHAYEKIITDVIARTHRGLGEEVFYLTGLDEHGQKVQQAALERGKTPQVHCDELAAVWRTFVTRLQLTNDDFVRTSEPRHKRFVQAMLARLQATGHFYRATYSGFYSTKEETFLREKDRRPDGTFDPVYGEVTQLEEDNYYFRMGVHRAWLIDHIESHPEFIAPEVRRNEVLGFLRNHALEDLCISRPAARLNWGIPLPFDSDYVTYVWFDALVNYASVPAALGDPALAAASGSTLATPLSGVELWPANVQVVGKDIVRFHAVFWPIMLKAMGLALPRQILVHGWWQKDGEKMSKTAGNIVDPLAVIDEWGVDAFRYYVVRELDVGADGNWTDAGFQARYKAELADGLGNLVNRSLSMLQRYRKGIVPPRSDELAPEVSQAAEHVIASLRKHRLQEALITIFHSIVSRTNQYVDQTAPFKLAKDPARATRLDEVLYNLAETCRVLAVLLGPFLPGTGEKIYTQLGLRGAPGRLSASAWGGLAPGHAIGTPSPLFPRKDPPASPDILNTNR